MTTPEFGTLETVDLREAWPHEAHNFTPWLADNLDRLSDAIGIPLESEGTEVQVEQFTADIFARNPQDDSFVLIENQLEGSDHSHLGQILTYLAGLEARTVIWVARNFQDAHLSAIRWLNENTTDQFAFFATQVKVVRIGDSPLVPLFDVLERPSEWDRQIRAASQQQRGGLSERGLLMSEFWRFYSERYPDDGVRQGLAGYNAYHSIEDSDIRVSQFVAPKSRVVGVFIGKQRNVDSEESIYEIANPYGPSLMHELDFDPDDPPVTFTAECGRYYANVSSSEEYDLDDQTAWTEAADWLHEYLHIYLDILSQPPTSQS